MAVLRQERDQGPVALAAVRQDHAGAGVGVDVGHGAGVTQEGDGDGLAPGGGEDQVAGRLLVERDGPVALEVQGVQEHGDLIVRERLAQDGGDEVVRLGLDPGVDAVHGVLRGQVEGLALGAVGRLHAGQVGLLGADGGVEPEGVGDLDGRAVLGGLGQRGVELRGVGPGEDAVQLGLRLALRARLDEAEGHRGGGGGEDDVLALHLAEEVGGEVAGGDGLQAAVRQTQVEDDGLLTGQAVLGAEGAVGAALEDAALGEGLDGRGGPGADLVAVGPGIQTVDQQRALRRVQDAVEEDGGLLTGEQLVRAEGPVREPGDQAEPVGGADHGVVAVREGDVAAVLERGILAGARGVEGDDRVGVLQAGDGLGQVGLGEHVGQQPGGVGLGDLLLGPVGGGPAAVGGGGVHGEAGRRGDEDQTGQDECYEFLHHGSLLLSRWF